VSATLVASTPKNVPVSPVGVLGTAWVPGSVQGPHWGRQTLGWDGKR
jgi:hypothetical protein